MYTDTLHRIISLLEDAYANIKDTYRGRFEVFIEDLNSICDDLDGLEIIQEYVQMSHEVLRQLNHICEDTSVMDVEYFYEKLYEKYVKDFKSIMTTVDLQRDVDDLLEDVYANGGNGELCLPF